MKILVALKQIEFAAKLFAAAGFTTFEAALHAKDEKALKSYIDLAVAGAPAKTVEKVVENKVEPTAEELQTLVNAEMRAQLVGLGVTVKPDENPADALKAALAANAASVAHLAMLNAGLAKSGIVVKASDEKKGVQEADITKAVDDRVSLKAAELTSQLGTKPVGTQVVASPAAAPGEAAKSQLTGLAKVQAAFQSDLKK